MSKAMIEKLAEIRSIFGFSEKKSEHVSDRTGVCIVLELQGRNAFIVFIRARLILAGSVTVRLEATFVFQVHTGNFQGEKELVPFETNTQTPPLNHWQETNKNPDDNVIGCSVGTTFRVGRHRHRNFVRNNHLWHQQQQRQQH